jgi:purine-binding chemotaxis protein CheW
MRVDHASELLEVADEAVETAGIAAPGARLTEGFVRLLDGLVVIHDLELFLSLDEGEQVDAAVTSLSNDVTQGNGT